ncbi:MAG: ribonuclease M5 [Bacillota bacterium]|nr:ribonuclease M5 [Bacillota bacterium]
MNIKETIVVEGRDDETAVLAAIDANVICTHGYGIRPETISVIEKAYNTTGIIIFTDPDHAGEEIRKRLTGLFPNAKQAFLTKSQAEKEGDIGIENAKPVDIISALEKASAIKTDSIVTFTIDDLVMLGLAGTDNSAIKRAEVGKGLGIGSANVKTFLKRLNYMGITKEELISVCK